MTRKQIESQITLNVGDTSANLLIQIYNAIDIVLGELRSRVEWSGRISEGFIRTTSGRYQYALEPDVHRLQGNFRVVDDGTVLQVMSTDAFNDDVPEPSGTGIPEIAMLPTALPVRQQPSSLVRLISSSTSDTMKVTVYGKVHGLVTSEAVTLTGSVTVGVLTTYYFSEVYRMVAASAAVGTVTATANSTSGNAALPTVAAVGDITVGTIAAEATASTNILNPGSLIRIKMSSDSDTGDRAQVVRIEGYTIDTANSRDRLFRRENLTTTNPSTTSVVSTLNFTELTAVTKGWNSSATLLVSADGGAGASVIIAEIGPDRRRVEYPQARFFNIPNGGTIHYRYIPAYIKMGNDNDTPPIPELYHQLLAEWSEKLVRGWHGDSTGVITLSGNPAFDRAVAEAKIGSRLQPATSITIGGGWQQHSYSRLDLPITPS